MKRNRKILAFVLAIVLLAVSLCACQTNAQRREALLGTYTITLTSSEEQIMILMESIEAYEEEIALVDMTSLKYVQELTFSNSGSYTFAKDSEGTKACVRSFYEGYLSSLYAGRTTLNEVYETTFNEMTEEEFRQYYADVYGCADYTALIDLLTENAFDYEDLAKPWETGTFSVDGSKINFTPSDGSGTAYVTYTLEEGALKLVYSNDVEVYSKIY